MEHHKNGTVVTILGYHINISVVCLQRYCYISVDNFLLCQETDNYIIWKNCSCEISCSQS